MIFTGNGPQKEWRGLPRIIPPWVSGLKYSSIIPTNQPVSNKKQKSIIEDGYHGVLLAPFFYKESLGFFQDCRENGLQYVTFNTYIEDSKSVCHVGQDLVQSGMTAASLMHMLNPGRFDKLIVHVEEDLENARHMQEKEYGFLQFFNKCEDEHGSVEVLKISNLRKIEKLLLEALDSNDRIGGIFVSTSKVYAIAGILEKHSISKPLIGYDLLDENLKYLNSGIIDFLIYQNPALQTSLGISTLVDHIVFKMEIPQKKLLPVEIVIKENIENYLQ